MSHAAVPEGSPAPAAADVVLTSVPDVLAGLGREARPLPLSGCQFKIIELIISSKILSKNDPQSY